MAARPRPNSVEYGNSKATVHCCPRLNVRVHSSKVELAAAGLCVFGGLWVDMWRLVHQWSFLLFWLSLDCFWPLLYQSSQVYQDCTNSVPIIKNSQPTVKTAKMTIGVKMVTCLLRVRRTHKALRRASIRLAWYRHMPASSLIYFSSAQSPSNGLTLCAFRDSFLPSDDFDF